ncbi:putative holin [Enterobacter sp. 22466]|uniref:putative holin n=1 Tax=Enterobacter sp. 22466 TaxID=3453924 RepID=UPI003F82C34C
MIVPQSHTLSSGSGILSDHPAVQGILSPPPPTGVVLGAFAGAVIFVISAHELSVMQKALLFGVSLMAGILGAPFAANVISVLTPTLIVAPPEVGALLASTLSVRLLLTLSSLSNSLLNKWLGGGKI